MTPTQFEKETKSLIDSLKSICSTYGLGGEGETMPIALKDEIMKEITSEEKTLGRKHTLEDIRDSTFSVLKKYAFQVNEFNN